MGVAIFELFDEPSLSGVTIETNGQESYLLNDFILAHFRRGILEVVYLKGYQLYLIEDLVLKDPS